MMFIPVRCPLRTFAGQPKVRVVGFIQKMQLQTDGTTTPSYIDIQLPEALEWGPYLDSLQVQTSTENRTAQFTWRVVFWWSIDGRRWNGPVDLFSAVSANQDVIQTAYSTTTNFGLYMRYGIAVANASGTNIERAVCSATLVFTFKS